MAKGNPEANLRERFDAAGDRVRRGCLAEAIEGYRALLEAVS